MLREYGARLGFADVSSRPLGQEEADTMRPLIVASLQWVSEQMDNVLTYTNRAHATAEFWALDDEDAGKLADFWLARARKHKVAAYSARVVVQVNASRELLSIAAPRVIETFRFYMRNGGIGY